MRMVAYRLVDSDKLPIGHNTEQSMQEWLKREMAFGKHNGLAVTSIQARMAIPLPTLLEKISSHLEGL